MATQQTVNRAVVALVPVDRIQFHPRNVRKSLGDLRELEANVWAEGVLQPPLLHRRGQLLEVVDGHRRLAATRLAGLRKVPAVVVAEMADDEVLTKMLGTALTKQNVTPTERRAAVRTLTEEFGHTRQGLAERFGVSYSTICNWLASPQERGEARPTRPAGRRIQVGALCRVLDEWEDRAQAGLSPAAAVQLLAELRALIPSTASAGSTAPVAEASAERRAA